MDYKFTNIQNKAQNITFDSRESGSNSNIFTIPTDTRNWVKI